MDMFYKIINVSILHVQVDTFKFQEQTNVFLVKLRTVINVLLMT
jgi:hypothetical protein